jgi:succinate-semialdehyde dehydrogenase/glutarate-semialdehyde dehydrogenase
MNFASVNPYTEETLATYDFISDNVLWQQVEQAHKAQKNWRKVDISKRVQFIQRLAQLLKDQHEELALLATLEMGKPFAEAKLEVLKCARGCEYYAANAEAILSPKSSIAETGKTVTINYEPLGVILGVFPWNFPYWQILRSAIPTILAGNTMLVKPAPNVPQCSLAIQQLINACGIPQGVLQITFANQQQVAQILADNRIKAATLTGSEKAGSAVASMAAKHIKKSVLELGGSDPFIVLDDADLTATLNQAIVARFQNNGQSCIAAKRFILHRSIAQDFLQQLQQKVAELICGNPQESSTQIGPLARLDLKEKLTQQVDTTLTQGATLFYQQADIPKTGYFYPPTILTNIPSQSVAYREELFGPVISVFVVDTDEEAIFIANDTDFGLGASVWSKDVNRALAIANEIESGQVFINEMVKSQPGNPFGGVKKSGYGRELGEYGLYEFCNIKAIWL